jgi:hypothetical protein
MATTSTWTSTLSSTEFSRRQVLGGMAVLVAPRIRPIFARPPKLLKRSASLNATAAIQAAGTVTGVGGSGIYADEYGDAY